MAAKIISGTQVAAEIREIEGRDKTVQTLLTLCTAIEEKWLAELFPEDLAGVQRVFYDASARRVNSSFVRPTRIFPSSSAITCPVSTLTPSISTERVAVVISPVMTWSRALVILSATASSCSKR